MTDPELFLFPSDKSRAELEQVPKVTLLLSFILCFYGIGFVETEALTLDFPLNVPFYNNISPEV